MTAPKGTVLEVVYIEGDRYNHRNSNRYWVLLPPDQWGRRVTGWARGNVLEHVPPPPTLAAKATVTEAPKPAEAPPAPSETAPPVEKVVAARALVADVVLHFEFGKSALTDEARRVLDSAITKPTSNTQGLTIELEGHTDWVGREAYNQRLGLARAQTVKRYLTEHFGFAADLISVVSFGETDPVAPNTSKAGRAKNRRVVIKNGGGPNATR